MKEVYEALDAWISDAVSGLRVSTVGRVESYDATKQRAEVQPMIRRVVTLEDGSTTTELHPIITEVPVMFLGSGPYSITWPIVKGDIVLLVFADQSLDRWLPRGDIVDPADERSHALTDAIAIPGLRPFSAPVKGAPSAAGGAMVISTPGDVHVGQGGLVDGDRAAKKSDLEALLSAIDGAPVGSGPGAGDVTAFKEGILTALDSASFPVCASKVRVK